MRHGYLVPVLTLTVGFTMLAISCGGRGQPTSTPQPVTEPETRAPATPPPAPEPPKEIIEDFPSQPVETAPVVEPSVEELNRRGVLGPIYFSYDRYDLNEEARRILRKNQDWLRDNPSFPVRVEGHCDERGTLEYNLALGERRAKAVRDYLVDLGVDASRIRIVTYGEERPEDPGHGERAWSKNRRAVCALES